MILIFSGPDQFADPGPVFFYIRIRHSSDIHDPHMEITLFSGSDLIWKSILYPDLTNF